MDYRLPVAAAHRMDRPRTWWRHALAALAVAIYLGAGVAGLRALWAHWQAARLAGRGVAFGPPAPGWGAGVDPWGINVALDQYPDEQALARSLDLLVAGGFHAVRQRFPWGEIEPARGSYRWEPWDAIVRQCQARNLRIIAVLDGSPAWARAPEDSANPFAPPQDPADLAAFARAFALRYGGAIDDYQVWDEPNIYPHWGERDPDPAGYLHLLQAVRTSIREVDPGARLIAAGLAPTTEEEGRNRSELSYLHSLYAAGGRDLFDIVAAKPYGFWSGPEDRRVDPTILNFSRLVALHEEMVRQGDGQKPLWAVSWGWNALPADWQGRPSPWGNDRPELQYDRDLQAIERARQEWPWLGLMCYASWQPAAPPDDPVWGLALLDRQGQPGPLYQKLQGLAHGPQVLYPGHHTLPTRQEAPQALEIRFWGSRLDLMGPGRWHLTDLDGQPLARSLTARDGQRVIAVQGLTVGEHRLLLAAPALPLRVTVSREQPAWLPWWLAVALAVVAILATAGLWQLLRPYPWRHWFTEGLRAYRQLTPGAALAVGGGALVLLALAPGLIPSLLALGAVALAIIGRPDVGLTLAVFLVPFAPLLKQFGPARFSYLEIVTLLTVAAQLGRDAQALQRANRKQPVWDTLKERLRAISQYLNPLDVGWALLLAVAFLSLLVSEKRWVSLRELRVVVLQAAFLYWLLARARLDRAGILRLTDALILSATAISLQGLYQYAWTDQVIAAEGVRRIRGIYGSPNNLALVLGRLWPLMLAFALPGPQSRRRWAYGLAAIPTAVCLFLTFSRGAWLLGVPASLLVLALLAGKRARLTALGVLAAGLLALLPLFGTARLTSLVTRQGTTLLRLKLWEAAWDMVRDHPLFGVGLDNFLYQYPRYIRPEALDEPNLSHPHNFVLDFWLRLGLPGLFTFIWLQIHFFRQAFRAWRECSDPALRALTIGLLAGMADMLAHGLIDASFFVIELAGIFALSLGFLRRIRHLAHVH